MTPLRIKGPDRAFSDVFVILHIDRAGNWEEFCFFGGEARLHAATLGEPLAG